MLLFDLTHIPIFSLSLSDSILYSLSDSIIEFSIKLTKFGEDIDRIDEQIELIGMANPELKLLTDMFEKRKENQIPVYISLDSPYLILDLYQSEEDLRFAVFWLFH